MDILGIGGWELVAIFLIMLVVAGPKRMIQWSYTLGKYVSVLRGMWADTARMLQKEFDDAGVDVKVPEQPTRGNIQREVTRALSGVTKPVQDVITDTKKEVEPIRQAVSMPRTMNKPLSRTQPEEQPTPPESQNGHAETSPLEDYGTWTGTPKP